MLMPLEQKRRASGSMAWRVRVRVSPVHRLSMCDSATRVVGWVWSDTLLGEALATIWLWMSRCAVISEVGRMGRSKTMA